MSIAKVENKIMNSWALKKLTSMRSSSAIATAAVVSLVSKDALNCYYYVTQSLNNKKIPDDKRNFVAGLDLANGILNIVFQLGLGKFIVAHSDKFFDKHIAPKYYGEGAIKKFAETMKQNMKQHTPEAIKEAFDLRKNTAKSGMKLIATLVGTTIVCKRILVPLIATPMASFFRKQFDKNKKAENANAPLVQDTVSFQNSVNPNETNVKISNVPECFQSFVK